MSARNDKAHPREEYLNSAIKIDEDLLTELVTLRKEAAQLYNGALNYALVTDNQFGSLLKKRNTLGKFPLKRRDFSDLVFYNRSTFGLSGYQINVSRTEKDGQIEVIIPVNITKKYFDTYVWRAIKPYLKKSKAKGSERFELVYAVKKAKMAEMKTSDILLNLRKGTLPHFSYKRDFTPGELNIIINRAEKSMAFKDAS